MKLLHKLKSGEWSKSSRLFVFLFTVALVISFAIPANVANPSPTAADEGICKWAVVSTPDTDPGTLKNLYSPVVVIGEAGSEIVKLLVGNDGHTMYAIVSRVVADPVNISKLYLFRSGDGGISWGGGIYDNLVTTITGGTLPTIVVWDIAIAPDDPDIIVAAVSRVATLQDQYVYLSLDGGTSWVNTNWPPSSPALPANSFISAMDISEDYGDGRDIIVGTRNGTGLSSVNLWSIKLDDYFSWSSWNVQNDAGSPASTNPIIGDILAIKYSPTYLGDATIVVVYSQPNPGTAVHPLGGTFLATGVHDLVANSTTWQPESAHIEIKNSTSVAGMSPTVTEIITADLELPSDFSGQSSSLSRFYVSTDAIDRVPQVAPNRGVYRIDYDVVYTLMDNTATFASVLQQIPSRRAASIAYWGTYASGKLLVGERMGQGCLASVGVWFTDSPTVCPIPCWYPALKPPTGAAGAGPAFCESGFEGYGNAQVVWSPTYASQGVAYAVTGSMSLDDAFAVPPNQLNGQFNWPGALFNVVALDESGFSLTRNNGETWNQLSLIDTRIIKLTDVAPSADCTTVYLASVNDGNRDIDGSGCMGFDSVWRSSTNVEVVAPLPVFPIGEIWERVRCSVTALSCEEEQTDYAILRLAPDKQDGQIVGWAAGGTSGLAAIGNQVDPFPVGANTRALAWSPDYGDYWAFITPRNPIQDFAFESSTLLYLLDLDGVVQKMPYTGTAWSTIEDDSDTTLGSGHTIVAQPEGKVLVGAAVTNMVYPASASLDGAATWNVLLNTPPTLGNFHVAFDPAFDSNKIYYIADDSANGTVYRVTYPGIGITLADTDMMAAANGAIGTMAPHPVGIYGLRTAYTGGALYAAHQRFEDIHGITENNSHVDRTLSPLAGMPKPGIEWDSMRVYPPQYATENITFTLEPWSLKSCGCLTLDTNTKLWAIDNDIYSGKNNVDAGRVPTGEVKTSGLLWNYTDCLAKKGPALITADGTLIGCDPVSGRAQEVNLCWEQLCVADAYDIEIAKDKDFNIRVLDWVIEGLPTWDIHNNDFAWWDARLLEPANVLDPCVYIPAGGSFADWAESDQEANGSAIAFYGQLECGHIYYWSVRARSCATGELIRSPWSTIRSFTIKAGLPTAADYYGMKLLSPNNGCLGCPVKPASFSWSPFKETTRYKFVLAKDAAMTQVVAEAEVPTTAYEYNGTLDYSTNYFWRVMSLEPSPSDWSATFSFQTESAASTEQAAPKSTSQFWSSLLAPAKAAMKTLANTKVEWVPVIMGPAVWAGIVLGAILLICWIVVMVSISRVRRRRSGEKPLE